MGRRARTAGSALLIGALLGLMVGGIGGFRVAQAIYEARMQEAADVFSATSPSVDREARRIVQRAEARARAIRQGDESRGD